MLVRLPRRSLGYFVVFVGAWVGAAAPISIGSDGLFRFEALDLLLRHGELDRGRYSLVGPVCAAPLWYLGEALGTPGETVWLFNRVAFLAGLVGLWLALRPVLSPCEHRRFIVLLLLGSMFPWHMMGFFAEVFHAVCVGTGLTLLATRRGTGALLGGVLCAFGTVNVPATVVGLGFAACALVWHTRRLRYFAVPVFAAALILLENYVRRGNPLDGGYASETGSRTVLPYSGLPDFSYPLFFGVLSILFSFGKGLVFFAPGLFARYLHDEQETGADRTRLVYYTWIAVVVGLVLVYSRWWAWYGGGVWGPRFFLFAALPASLVLTRWITHAKSHSALANVLVLLAVALSCWVGANGIVFQEHGTEQYSANNFEFEYVTWYVPECSVLWLPFVVHKHLDWQDYARLTAFALGFAYLARPLVLVLAGCLCEGCVSVWRSARSGARWRV
ncbi:Uncharacterized protein OS=Ktedonobacter racemifer DSM 44963 GN=Krac_4797 PE=4 SV=1 [Gemmata massiliana]|uniref:Glycosyltransferase RgtA/B/C/D-like domain-containing protein n=1 Tax=Gemmata massiliana TaxID=1210884 RepID=A0A6P2CYQ6_9BACT|nr:hypothetical protein [Gemmata massiliana]VTR94268.1 Uncharacterized protein OS=Ktedonobacter racemifer DSM 44963 GN=Krac_4797 PE=4 SV=1 [Gemmata massiliana]